MPPLLFLSHRIPYPPNKGDKIRSFHLLKYFSQYYRVHLGAFIDDANDWEYAPDVRHMCASTYFSQLNPAAARLRSLAGLASGTALSLSYYRDSAMQAWVDRVMLDEEIERIFVFSSAMAQFVAGREKSRARRVIDFVDVDSDKWAQYAASKPWPMSWVYQRESKTLLDYDSALAADFDASVFVSAREAELFRQLAPGAADRVSYINNGVDVEYFSSEREFSNPYAASEKAIVFTGAMDYWANVDAVSWFAREVFPQLYGQDSDCRFYIVGARPSTQVQQLSAMDGVIVTGALRDIRPYIRHAALSVAPLRIARGVQNKVLEAMAMARPVVASPQALDGLDVAVGREVLIADGADAFTQRISDVLAGAIRGEEIGKAGRARVLGDYTWENKLKNLHHLFDDHESQPGSAAAETQGACLAAHQ